MLGKLQLYAAALAAFAISLVGVYFAGSARGKDKIKRALDQNAIKNLRTAKEVQDEVRSLDDDGLRKRGNKWLRKDNG